jgi:hypothetical protein
LSPVSWTRAGGSALSRGPLWEMRPLPAPPAEAAPCLECRLARLRRAPVQRGWRLPSPSQVRAAATGFSDAPAAAAPERNVHQAPGHQRRAGPDSGSGERQVVRTPVRPMYRQARAPRRLLSGPISSRFATPHSKRKIYPNYRSAKPPADRHPRSVGPASPPWQARQTRAAIAAIRLHAVASSATSVPRFWGQPELMVQGWAGSRICCATGSISARWSIAARRSGETTSRSSIPPCSLRPGQAHLAGRRAALPDPRLASSP